MRIFRRKLWLLQALLCGVPLLAGCDLFPRHSETKVERTEKDIAAGLPGQHSLRVPPFIFLADVKLREDSPMFKDLSKLRDQVYRELKLPASNTEVFVYLFEDKARYEKFIKTK